MGNLKISLRIADIVEKDIEVEGWQSILISIGEVVSKPLFVISLPFLIVAYAIYLFFNGEPNER